VPRYIPKKGDFVVLSFDPQTGREQQGRRPALVVSSSIFNKHTGLAMVCPITNTTRGFPFHVAVPAETRLTGCIMAEQLKSVDYASRKVKFVAKAPGVVLDEVLSIIDACLYESP
jgi:mRNA interferase MazF